MKHKYKRWNKFINSFEGDLFVPRQHNRTIRDICLSRYSQHADYKEYKQRLHLKRKFGFEDSFQMHCDSDFF